VCNGFIATSHNITHKKKKGRKREKKGKKEKGEVRTRGPYPLPPHLGKKKKEEKRKKERKKKVKRTAWLRAKGNAEYELISF